MTSLDVTTGHESINMFSYNHNRLAQSPRPLSKAQLDNQFASGVYNYEQNYEIGKYLKKNKA